MYGTYDVASGSNQTSPNSKLLFLQINRKQNLHWKRITVKNLNLDYIRLFSKSEADALFQEAEKGIKYNANSKVFVYGKWHKISRKQTAYGDAGLNYTFSGTTVPAQPCNNAPFLKDISDLIYSLTNHKFNFVVVNRYNDGSDYLGEQSNICFQVG